MALVKSLPYRPSMTPGAAWARSNKISALRTTGSTAFDCVETGLKRTTAIPSGVSATFPDAADARAGEAAASGGDF